MIDELTTLAVLRARDQGQALLATVRSAMVEVDRPGRLALIALLADGHLLIEDVPGVGKTTLARIIARAIGGHDARVQCTADLGPADVMGRVIPSDNPTLRPDVFDPGPIFANAVVMDEINRATPKLQSALFEAMEERFVTVAKTRHALPRPFFVVATMNPYEGEAEMYRLPHGQRDRFALCTGLGYPSEAGEMELLDRFGGFDVLAEIDPIVAPGDVVKVQRAVALIEVPAAVREYAVRLVRATREEPRFRLGASPRATLSLQRCCQALALIDNAEAVTTAHVRELAEPCLAHRIQGRADVDVPAVLAEIVARTPVPIDAPATAVAVPSAASLGYDLVAELDGLSGLGSLRRADG
jgi:MoxR-like ATPase